jgi:hypothetical protein
MRRNTAYVHAQPSRTTAKRAAAGGKNGGVSVIAFDDGVSTSSSSESGNDNGPNGHNMESVENNSDENGN